MVDEIDGRFHVQGMPNDMRLNDMRPSDIRVAISCVFSTCINLDGVISVFSETSNSLTLLKKIMQN